MTEIGKKHGVPDGAGELIVLSLGGNLGNVPANFRTALKKLAAAGLREPQISSLYRTAPVACVPGTPDFTNAVLAGLWLHSLDDLFCTCKRIEEDCGRPADHESYASRSLDLDIIFFGNSVICRERLQIPHRDAATRPFVLVPLAELLPDFPFPGMDGVTVAELLRRHPDRQMVSDIRNGNQGSLILWDQN